MEAKTFKTALQPSLGTPLMEVRYDPRPTPPAPAAVGDGLERVLGELHLLRHQLIFSEARILVAIEEQSLRGQWRRFRRWVVSFFKR